MESKPQKRLLEVPPGAIESIRKIYNLDQPGRLEEAINILEEWILKQDHILKKDFSKDYSEKCLISCKGSVEKAKIQIDRLCTMKTLLPKFFLKTNVKAELQSITDMAYIVALPKLTEDFYRVIIVKIMNKTFTPETFLQYFQYSIILTEYIKAHDYVNGFIIVEDYVEVNIFDLLSKMNHSELQQFINIIIEGYGARLKRLLILSDSKAIELLIKIVKQLLSEKIGNRIQVRQTIEELCEVLPKEMLPLEYGGSERSVQELHEEWIEELSSEKHIEYMKMMNKACTDETKRLEGKFNEEYLGMPGAFRSLSVD